MTSSVQEFLHDEFKRLEEITRTCSMCHANMFWYGPWAQWLCVSWLHMEGGCAVTQGEDHAPVPQLPD